MKTFFIASATVIAAIVLLLFIVCGFIYNQLAWRKTIKVPQFLMIMTRRHTKRKQYLNPALQEQRNTFPITEKSLLPELLSRKKVTADLY